MTRADRRPRRRLDPGRRRSAILDEARGAFARAPYDQVSLASVARAAGASEALVHKYFKTKEGLYAEVVRTAIEALLNRQREADAALGPGACARERLARSIEVYLEFVASAPEGWASPLRTPHDGAREAAMLRAQSREHYVALLREVLGLPPGQAGDYALHGYLGFLDAACLAWVAEGCPPGQRAALAAAALGALNGALSALAPPPPDAPARSSQTGQAARPDQAAVPLADTTTAPQAAS
jgi:AcrR family transcriptional regulator